MRTVGEIISESVGGERPIRRLGVTRRQLLEELDRLGLKPLPTEPYAFAEWRVRRVGIDYHVDVEGHFYAFPIASRAARSRCGSPAAPWRSSSRASGSPCTCDRAATARRYADWTIGRIRRDAALIGSATAALCDLILEQRRPHPEQGFRSCLGILRLARPFGVARLEAAATRAIEIGALTYGSVRSILDDKLDRPRAPAKAREALDHGLFN